MLIYLLNGSEEKKRKMNEELMTLLNAMANTRQSKNELAFNENNLFLQNGKK